MGVQQISLWEDAFETFRPKKIRLYQFFAGIGAQAQAFKELGLEFEDYKIAEWSVPSIKAYNAIHRKDYTDYSQGKSREDMIQIVKNVSLDYNQPISEKQLNSKSDEWVRDVYNNIIATHNLVNICNVKGSDLEIDTDYTNLIFYSFPCQDLSKAGLRKGLNAERSGLLWEIERILKELTDEERKSCVLICENVPDLVEVNFVKDFAKWTAELERIGFENYCEILNAKDYGVPQNRRRVFMVSLPGAYSYVFPRKMQLEYHLKDFLQEKPDNKYFLSQRIIDFFIANTEKQKELGNGHKLSFGQVEDAPRIECEDHIGRFPANVVFTYDETDFNEVCGNLPNENDISAARYFYCAKASKKDRDAGLINLEKKNIHPTVKPVELMQYLIRLVCPKGAIILDIFNGSGSTGKAVAFENRERDADYKYIGIELDKEYCEISKGRIDYALNKYEYDFQEYIEEQKEKTGQLNLFDFAEDDL